jgi:hypothetical protein
VPNCFANREKKQKKKKKKKKKCREGKSFKAMIDLLECFPQYLLFMQTLVFHCMRREIAF